LHKFKNNTHNLKPRYNAFAISVAREERKDWSRNLSVQLEEFHNKYGLKPEFLATHHRMFDIIGPVSHLCPRGHLESYGAGDGEKRACGLSNRYFTNRNNESCVVYSIGSKNQWSFEYDIVTRTNCTVETFDCTLHGDIHPPASIQHRVRFHKVCLGTKDSISNGTEFRTYKSLLKLTGISHSPTFMKMDIEGWEYSVLRHVIDTGQDLPDQIAFELHGITHEKGLSWNDRHIKSVGEMATFIDFLWRFGGYYLLDRHDNKGCGWCSELLIGRIRSIEND